MHGARVPLPPLDVSVLTGGSSLRRRSEAVFVSAALAVSVILLAGCEGPGGSREAAVEAPGAAARVDARVERPGPGPIRDDALLVGTLNPDAPLDSIETRFASEGDDKWIEWHTGYGPTGRQASLPINNPPVVEAADATHMEDDDAVVGVLLDGRARAYPWWRMTSGHLVNDVLAGEPIVVTLCERCSGAAAFKATLSGRMLDFRLAGVHEGTWFCADFQTGSFWHPFAGEAWRGPLKGQKLERVRAYQMTWAEWQARHPETTVVLASEEVRHRRHSRWVDEPKHPGTPHDLKLPRLEPEKPNPRARWLLDHAMVFGLHTGPQRQGKAYPVARILEAGGLVQEEVEGEPIVLVARGDFEVGAYSRRLGSTVLDFELHSEEPWRLVDQEGTHWDEWGQAVEGPRQGELLELLDGYLTEWYEWLYRSPGTELFGRG